MRAGLLRHRITIQQELVNRDNYGEEQFTWSDVATIWAAVEPQTGSENWTGQSEQRVGQRLTRFRIRRRTGLDTEMRVKYNSRYFDIQSIIEPLEARREIWLIAEEQNV